MKLAGGERLRCVRPSFRTTARAGETPLTPPPPGKRGAPPTAGHDGQHRGSNPGAGKHLSSGSAVDQRVRLPGRNPPDKIVGVTWAQQAAYMAQAWKVVKSIPRIDIFVWFLLRERGFVSAGLAIGPRHPRMGRAKPSRKTFMELK